MDLLWAMLVVTLAGKPIPFALVSCDEIGRHTDGPSMDSRDHWGAALKTDSRGKMVFTAPEGEYHCRAWKTGFRGWEGVLHVSEEKLTFTITLLPVEDK